MLSLVHRFEIPSLNSSSWIPGSDFLNLSSPLLGFGFMDLEAWDGIPGLALLFWDFSVNAPCFLRISTGVQGFAKTCF